MRPVVLKKGVSAALRRGRLAGDDSSLMLVYITGGRRSSNEGRLLSATPWRAAAEEAGQ